MSLPKSHYSPTIATLQGISLSAGLFAWFTQFLLPSPSCTLSASRLHSTLALTSLLLLSNILTTTFLSSLLYPLHPHSLLTGTRKHFLKLGIVISYLVLLTSIVLIAIAVEISLQGQQVTEDKWLGWVGVGVFALVVVGILVLGFTEKAPKSEANIGEEILTAVGNKVPTLGKKRIIFIMIVFVLEILGLVALLVLGGREIVEGSFSTTVSCAGTGVGASWDKDNPLPVDILGQQEVDIVVVVTVTEVCGDVPGETVITKSSSSNQEGKKGTTVVVGTVTTTSTTKTVFVTA